MKGKQKFYICNHCKNLASLVLDSGQPLVCCGDKMAELIPNTVDASSEKHVPQVTDCCNSGNSLEVQVGSVLHPMTDEHYIPFIYVETEHGGQCKYLKPGDEPKAKFKFSDDNPVAVYEYCNLHGLWKREE